ncbi:hypothetical protein [Paenibacillus agilis]|uniref:DUF4760 domain-containing protein n=1 Tax=Paenibacillus agilis TaxID=3020863 RepID=A0A559IZL1_9BACL|nr:hypothetical protein [Paenibacillus agilis]TVX93066.1 hypothetical protein FPZ44_08325 [Paenibacillus agilis]
MEVWIGLIGALIGGVATYLGARYQAKNQFKILELQENSKISEEKEKANDIIKVFLENEIVLNSNKLMYLKEYLIVGYDAFHASGDIITLQNDLQINEYNSAKYDLLKVNTLSSIMTIELYQSFLLVMRYEGGLLSELSRDEFNFLKSKVKDWEKAIENSYKTSYLVQRFKEVEERNKKQT